MLLAGIIGQTAIIMLLAIAFVGLIWAIVDP